VWAGRGKKGGGLSFALKMRGSYTRRKRRGAKAKNRKKKTLSRELTDPSKEKKVLLLLYLKDRLLEKGEKKHCTKESRLDGARQKKKKRRGFIHFRDRRKRGKSG